jgi:hypothetical protein
MPLQQRFAFVRDQTTEIIEKGGRSSSLTDTRRVCLSLDRRRRDFFLASSLRLRWGTFRSSEGSFRSKGGGYCLGDYWELRWKKLCCL